MAGDERNGAAETARGGESAAVSSARRSLGSLCALVLVLFGSLIAAVRLGEDDRVLPPDLEFSQTGQLFVAPTANGWAVLADDWIQHSVDGEWKEPVPIEVEVPEVLEDVEGWIVRHQFVATDDGFAFIALHRFSNGAEGDLAGTAYRFVSADGVSWTIDPLTSPVASIDPLGIGMHTDDGFTVVRRTDRPGGGVSHAIDFHFAASPEWTIVEGAASALGPAARAGDGSVAFAEQVLGDVSRTECVERLDAARGTVSALNVWAPGAEAPMVVPFPCRWQTERRWLGEGAVSFNDDRIQVASSIGLWILGDDGTTVDVVEWEQPNTSTGTLLFTPDGSRVVRIGGDDLMGPQTVAVYDIGADEWTPLAEWPDVSAILVRLVDDDALFYVDARVRMLRSVSLR